MTGAALRSFLVAVLPAALLLGYFVWSGAVPLLPAVVIVLAVSGGALYAVRRRVAAEQAVLARLNRLTEEAAAQSATLGYKAAVADRLVAALPDPLFFLDRRRRVVRANRGAEALFDGDPTGRELGEGLRHPELLAAIDRALAGEGAQTVEVDLPAPVAANYVARVEPIDPPPVPARAHDGELPQAPAVLVDLQDVTALVRSEQMRVDFVANVSHELRTPLTSLTGFIETLRGPAKEDPEARERFLSIMHEQAERMFRLISDLLSLSRIEMDEHSRPTGAVAIPDVIETVTGMLARKAEEKEMRLDVDLATDLPRVRGDDDQLVQVFQNLIDNAIKYGAAGTRVGIQARRHDSKRVAVEILDTGPGVPSDHIPRLTERFYRVDTARSRALGGTGLGLAIVKHIVNRHRGRLSISSREGEGSRFTVTLPIAEARDAPGEPDGRAGDASGAQAPHMS